MGKNRIRLETQLALRKLKLLPGPALGSHRPRDSNNHRDEN